MATKKPKNEAYACVYPECENEEISRGLCGGHYAYSRKLINAGLADEEDLVQRGLLLRKRRNAGRLRKSAFYKGSDVRGDGE